MKCKIKHVSVPQRVPLSRTRRLCRHGHRRSSFFINHQQMTQILVLHHRVAIKRHSPISFHFNSHIVEFADTLVHLYFSRSFLCRFTLSNLSCHRPSLTTLVSYRIEQQIEPRNNHHLSTLHCPLIVIRIAMGLLIGGGGEITSS